MDFIFLCERVEVHAYSHPFYANSVARMLQPKSFRVKPKIHAWCSIDAEIVCGELLTPRRTFMNLNDDCKLKIIENLTPTDLTNVAHVCKSKKQTGQILFPLETQTLQTQTRTLFVDLPDSLSHSGTNLDQFARSVGSLHPAKTYHLQQ